MRPQNAVFVFSTFCFIYLLSLPGSTLASPSLDTIARVNQTTITRQNVAQEISIIETDSRLRNQSWHSEQLANLTEQVKEILIERELLFQKARQRNIEIRPQWIKRTLVELKNQIGSKSAFMTYLTNIGLTMPQLEKRIHKGLIIQRLLHREVLRNIKISESEMQAFFKKQTNAFIDQDQIRVRQIFIAADKDDISGREKALMRIQSIQKHLEEGANFTVMALEYSEDNSRAKGGDLGYLARSQMLPSFAKAAFELQPGKISHIVETPIGYHLIKMVDYVPSSRTAYHNARSQIERTIRRTKENEAARAYLIKLEKQAVILR